VVGDGGSKPELEEHARRLDWERRIVFTGFRGDVPNLLSEAAISVLPSLSQGNLQYLARIHGRWYPRCRDQRGGQSGGRRRRVSGLLVPPRDSAALAAAMARLLEDPDLALRLGQAGMRRVSELFSMMARYTRPSTSTKRWWMARAAYANPADRPHPPPHGGISVHVAGIHRNWWPPG